MGWVIGSVCQLIELKLVGLSHGKHPIVKAFHLVRRTSVSLNPDLALPGLPQACPAASLPPVFAPYCSPSDSNRRSARVTRFSGVSGKTPSRRSANLFLMKPFAGSVQARLSPADVYDDDDTLLP